MDCFIWYNHSSHSSNKICLLRKKPLKKVKYTNVINVAMNWEFKTVTIIHTDSKCQVLAKIWLKNKNLTICLQSLFRILTRKNKKWMKKRKNKQKWENATQQNTVQFSNKKFVLITNNFVYSNILNTLIQESYLRIWL